jgi:peptidoglycan/LPS O-acetylase OafA/YrhL
LSSAPRPAYRPDIDGLRALAVALVILYHAAVPGFGGGYVGVDVFFVISGYLITQLLVSSDGLSPRQRLEVFYLRRARRILPALLAVSALATAIACYVLLPLDLARFARYLGATPLFLSNVIAWLDGSYFEASLPRVALNHYWSIAVEEQFYLVYPALLLLIARYFPQHRRHVLMTMGVLSLVTCVWGAEYKPVASYYLAGTRAWELLLGAILALPRVDARERVPRGIERAAARLIPLEMIAAAAIVTILFCAMRYDTTTPYPGAYAIAPCMATAALLSTGRDRSTIVSRFLSSRALVFTGLISYSLYLWHWPILALSNYYFITDPQPVTVAMLIALTYAAACLSWRYIEQPVRSRRIFSSSRAFVRAAVLANVALLALAVGLWKSGGLPQRFSSDVRALVDAPVPMHPDAVRCMTVRPNDLRAGRICRFGPQDASFPKVVVWGDSHALALLPAYEALAWTHRVQLYFAASAACGPLLGVEDSRRLRVGQLNCADFNDAALSAVRRINPRLVILGGYWSSIDAAIEPSGDGLPETDGSLFRRGLERTLERIAAPNRSICVVLGVPTMRHAVPYAMAMERRRGVSADLIGVSRADALREYASPESDIRALEHLGVLTAVDPKDRLCPAAQCLYRENGEPMYRDSNHLSIIGARWAAPAIEPCFTPLERH